MTALFVLAQEYRAAADALADMDLDAQTVADTLESIGGDIEVKAQNVAMFARNLEATAEAINVHIKAQQARVRALTARAEHLRDYIARCMDTCGVTKIEAPALSISFRSATAVDVFEPDLIPAEYMRAPPPPAATPDKAAIAAALKAGADIPGARLETRRHLQIK